MRTSLLLAIGVLALPAPAAAHYNMLFPQAPSVDRGKEVKLTYQWGHPFEHELFDAPKPETVIVINPDGKKKDLAESLKKVSVKVGKKDVTAYEIAFVPEEVGDYVFALHTPPIWMAAEGEYYQDTVKVVLHVQAQKGWDHHDGFGLEFVPLTRPYGLAAGTIFQAALRGPDQAGPGFVLVSGNTVEIERYNVTPPKEVPAEEFITRAAKTDRNGVVTCDLPEAGWWCLTGSRLNGTKDSPDGKKVPLRERSTFWVYVAEKPRR